MTIVAGIDEAGYGPTLGPLVVSAAVFEVPEEHRDGDFWRALQPAVTANPRTRTRLLVADSKKAYSRSKGIGVLEETVLAFAGLQAGVFDNAEALLTALAREDAEDALNYPWYRPSELALPLSGRALGIESRIERLRRTQEKSGIRFLGGRCAPVFEAAFNRRCDETKNKHDLLCNLTLRLIAGVVERFADGDLVIMVDKQGGRDRYGPLLGRHFRGTRLHVRRQERQHAHYHMHNRRWQADVHFVMSGEEHALPIALASMFSKYVREIYMESFNAFWRRHLPELKPTAGYFRDARRFLEDIAPAREKLAIPDEVLIRKR